MAETAVEAVAGIILAGGLARRMGGGDKCLRQLGGKPILARIIERARPQVGTLAINANGDPVRFSRFGLPVVADVVPDFAGPLAGVLSGFDWAARELPGCRWLVTFAGDAPFVPKDLVVRLLRETLQAGADMACAASGGRSHPVVGLWPLALKEDLRRAMEDEGVRKVDVWTARFALAKVEWSLQGGDPFFNANRPEDLEEAEKLLASASA